MRRSLPAALRQRFSTLSKIPLVTPQILSDYFSTFGTLTDSVAPWRWNVNELHTERERERERERASQMFSRENINVDSILGRGFDCFCAMRIGFQIDGLRI